METGTTYEIHDNGGRPFRVRINGTTVRVYLLIPPDQYHNEPSLTIHSNRVFIGPSPVNSMTTRSGGSGKDYLGNSILVETKTPLIYVSIGFKIFTFKSVAKIVEYWSPVGNNDVPYPWAKDEEGNYYLILDEVVLMSKPNLSTDIAKQPHDNDPYSYYYNVARLITTDTSSNPHNESILKNFKSIEDMFVGDKRCCMAYCTDPLQDYDRMVKWNNGAAMTVRSTTGNTTTLNRDTYGNIIDEFGVAMGLKKLQVIENICEREGEVFSKSVIN